MQALIRLALLVCLASCAAPARRATPEPAPAPLELRATPPPQEPYPVARERFKPGTWNTGQPLMQGFFGVSAYSDVSVDGSGSEVDGDDGDLDQLPLIGGGGQWKLGGRNVDLGLEGLLSFSGRADAEAFVFGGGGAAVAVDVDLLIFELYGGPFASVMLRDKVRLYGAAGPLLQWADYDQSGDSLDDDGSGFGSGWYARTGIEFVLPSWTLIGLGVRWSDTTVDLGDLGDLEIDGFQGLVTVSRGI